MTSIFILLMNHLNQTASLAAYPRAIYSAMVVKVDTVFYFLLLYNTTALFKKK